MSDRIDFWEVRRQINPGEYDEYESICLCKDEDWANELQSIVIKLEKNKDVWVEHVEILATTYLTLEDY